jgi:hypothetical protein
MLRWIFDRSRSTWGAAWSSSFTRSRRSPSTWASMRARKSLARVRDFYIIHRELDETLNYPDFDYDDWLPPRTVSGEYNEHIARILREKLLQD